MILTKEEQELIIDLEKINKMTHFEMAKFIRFTPTGHSYFDMSKSLHKYFDKRFFAMGGMTVEISREIGWPETNHRTKKGYKRWVKKLES